ncbi:D-2-hydroxyglutaric acid dehydrogenase [Brevipalpus obovatus]|uniref:D-2-hydroxyglutaric acid dehydrogenase n=1 Tax=Brevipalpus obovatus TaxID=246614 RepID=UPI003D9F3BF7
MSLKAGRLFLSRLRKANILTVHRNQSKLASLHSDDVNYFITTLGPQRVKQDDLQSYNQDWLRLHSGQSKLVLFPGSTEDVSKILSYCDKKHLPLVVQAGNTSLVAGSVPDKDEIILSMGKMNKIEHFNDTTGVLQCESGCILENLESFVQERGFIMPYDLGAKGSCQIGGNIASNAGGIRFIRYGSLHGSVLGLEVVLPSGKILNMMSSLRKDNTGYDLKQLFIGSEGTLGVVTKVSILCPVKPDHKIVTFLAVDQYTKILDIMRSVRSEMSPYLSAFEMIDDETMDAVHTNLGLSIPFRSPFYVLFELSLSATCAEDRIEEQLHKMLEKYLDNGTITDGTISNDLTSLSKLWTIRERIAEALLADGKCFKYDVSLQHEHFYELVEVMRERLKLADVKRVSGYGHIGDNNLHLGITCDRKKDSDEIKKLIEPFVFEWIRDRNGSISAEHGLGQTKRNHIHFSKSSDVVAIMKQVKNLFDPNGVLNPKKMLPDD